MAVKLATLLLGEEGNDSAGGTSLSSPDRARRAKLMLPDTSRWLEALEILSGAACVTATATMNSAANQPQQQMQGGERGDGAEVRVQSVARLVGIQIRSALLRLDELLPATQRPPEISHAGGKSAGAGALLVVDRRLLRALVDCELIGQQLNDLSSEGALFPCICLTVIRVTFCHRSRHTHMCMYVTHVSIDKHGRTQITMRTMGGHCIV
jgi:hypothetical protein